MNKDEEEERRGKDGADGLVHGRRKGGGVAGEWPEAGMKQGVILIDGAHRLITGFSLRSAGVRPDPNPH